MLLAGPHFHVLHPPEIGSNQVIALGGVFYVGERDKNDPIALASFLVQIRKRLTQAGISGADLRVYRVQTGDLIASVDAAPSADYVLTLGFFGDGGDKSAYRIVVIADGYQIAEIFKSQTLTGGEALASLEDHALVYVAGASPAGVLIDAEAKTITLTEATAGRDLYSYLWGLWEDGSLTTSRFPIWPRESRRLALFNGWTLTAESWAYLRGTGIEVLDDGEQAVQTWANISSVLDPGEGVRLYYSRNGGAAVDFDAAGPVNQLIDVSEATTSLIVYARAEGRVPSSQEILATVDDTQLRATVYPVAITTSVDAHVQASDAEVDAQAPYTAMALAYPPAPVERTVGGLTGRFDVIVDGAGADFRQIYTWLQRRARLPAYRTEPVLVEMRGDTLYPAPGLFIDNLGTGADSVIFTDLDGATLQPPPVTTLALSFGSAAAADPDARFALYFAEGYGQPVAVIVEDAGGAPIAGLVGGQTGITRAYDYAGNVQRGEGSAGTDADVVLVVQGRSVAQGAVSQATITDAASLAVAAVPVLNEAYEAPPAGILSSVDTAARRITISDQVESADAVQIASAIADWFIGEDGARLYLPPPVRTVGRAETGATILILEPWRIVVDHDLTVIGDVDLDGAEGEPWIYSGRLRLREGVQVRTITQRVGSGLDDEERGWLRDINRVHGLDPAAPLSQTVELDPDTGKVKRNTKTAGDLVVRDTQDGPTIVTERLDP